MQPPIEPKVEAAAALLKGAVSAVPVIGGVLSEVGNLYLNPLERRKQRWMREVTLALKQIQERFDLLPGELENDERFVSFLYQATLVALKNHKQSKLAWLRNALVNAVDRSRLDEDLAFQFLRYVNDLTESHIRILAAVASSVDELRAVKTLEQVHSLLRPSLGEIDRLTFRAFLQDLDARFLVRIGDLEDYPEFASTAGYIALESSEIKPLQPTDLGCSFLTFLNAAGGSRVS